MNKELNTKQINSKFWKNKPIMKSNNFLSKSSKITDLKDIFLYNDTNNHILPDKLSWNLIDKSNDENLLVVADFLNKFYQEKNNINFTLNLLKFILGEDGFVLSIITKNNNALCGVVLVSIKKIIVFEKNNKFAYVNLICSHPKYRKKGFLEVISNELIRYLNVEKYIQQGLFLSLNKISQPCVTLRKYYRPINYHKLVKSNFIKIDGNDNIIHNKFSLPISEVSKNYIPMKKNHINKVYELFNIYKSKYNLCVYYNINELENILLNNNIVKSYVILDETNENIIDFVSYYSVQYNCDNETINAGYIYLYSLLNEYGESMINNLVKIMNNNNIDIIYSYDDKNNMNILLTEKKESNEESDSETYDKVYENKFIKKEKKYVYLFNWETPLLTSNKTYFDFLI